MTTSITMDQNRPAGIRAERTRALAVMGAVLANVAIWAVAVPVLGIHLFTRFGNSAPQGVGLEAVVGSTLIAALVGWGLLAVLERRISRARETWTAIAMVVLVVSLSLPVVVGTTVSTKVALAMMHLVAATILIPALRPTTGA